MKATVNKLAQNLGASGFKALRRIGAQTRKKTSYLTLGAAALAAAFTSALVAGTTNPVAAFYSGPEGWPAWTADIKWHNVFNITNYGGGPSAAGAANFAAFETARDLAYNAGGGVVYFPAGTYDITLPDAGQGAGVGPSSRGLMLRSGVVILGDTPTGANQYARSNATYASEANLNPPTKLRFAKRTRYDEDNMARSIPTDWSFVGLQPEAGQGVKDVNKVGVVWVELQNATIFWGPDYVWSATYNDSQGWLGAFASKLNWPPAGAKWSTRVPDGTYIGDSFAGVVTAAAFTDATYTGAGQGRLVFGVKITDGMPVNDFWYASYNRSSPHTNSFGQYRYCGRISVYGSDVFIANNSLPMSPNCFTYSQWTKPKTGGELKQTVLWDPCNTIGIDVNKSLNGLGRPAATPGSGYYSTNVVVRDNWVFNRGNKGFEVSGQFAVLENNFNQRYYLGYTMPPAPYPNPGGSISMNWESGYNVYQPSDGEGADDTMSRGYDLGGRNLWVDGCFVVNAGSHGNDGEGIMGQRHNHIEIYSWAFTHSRQYVEDFGPDTIGENGWIGGYDIDSFGFLLLGNRCDGSIGLLSATGNNDLLDTANLGNYDNFGSPAVVAVVPAKVNPPLDYFDDGLGSGAIGGLPTDPPTAPTSLTATAMSDHRGVALSWTDNTPNEAGFRVERRINGGDWKVIAYRPRISLSKSSDLTDPWSPDTLVSHINNPVWEDYTAPRGQPVQYCRVDRCSVGLED